MDFIKDFTIERGERSTVTITGEVPFAELQKERAKAIAHLGTDVELDGFRKGHVPEKVLVGKIGEMRILTEMAEHALAHVYPEALKVHNIAAIGYPQIEITKIAPDNPLGFRATVAVMPEMSLPDYKKIAVQANATRESADVTDQELEEQIHDLLRQKIAYEKLQKKAAEEKENAEGVTELPTPETTKDDSAEELPELTDEYVKTLGQPGQFESVSDFKAKLRQHLEIEKAEHISAAHRAKITDGIIEETTLTLPQVLIDSEMSQMFAQMEEDLKRANLKMDDYLGHIKKTKEDLIKEWTPAAEKRAKLQLILNEIANKENITPDKSQLDAQVDQLLEQYKDADEARVRIYVASVMTNEAVMQMLETQ